MRFECPAGYIMTIHNQLIRCPELMFQPALNGKDILGLHKLSHRAVEHSPVPIRRELLRNIVTTPCSRTCLSACRLMSKVSCQSQLMPL